MTGRDKALKVLDKFYNKESDAYQALIAHGDAIVKKAKRLVARNPNMKVDMTFVEEAAYLHDVGIMNTNATSIGCHGSAPYIAHGLLGKKLLEREGLPKHARVAERHVGVGLTKEDIEQGELPLPKRDVLPETIEEEIICFVDLFFSKTPGKMAEEKDKGDIRSKLKTFGNRQAEVFDAWCKKFNE